MPNPISDVVEFIAAMTSDHVRLGNWRYVIGAAFVALIVVSVLVAIRNWKEDPSQRTGRHLGTWFARVAIGCMWFQGMLWKLPLPASDGLRFWTEQMSRRAAFEGHRDLVTNFVLPNIEWFGPFVFLAELVLAVSLILGLGVRLAGLIGVVFVLQLWLAIYIPGEPAEWPWSYIFLAMLMFLFALYSAGRSLGLDAWLDRHVPAVRNGTGFWGRFFKASA